MAYINGSKVLNVNFIGSALDSGVGEATANGGEVFNDYEKNKALSPYSSASGKNNIAGVMAWKITGDIYDNDCDYAMLSIPVQSENLNKLALGDVISIKWSESYINLGHIVDNYADDVNPDYVITSPLYVLIDNYDKKYNLAVQLCEKTWSESDDPVLFVVNKPNAGPTPYGLGQYAEGQENMALLDDAHTEGYNNKSIGRFSHTQGRDNIAHYCAHAEGMGTQATGGGSHSQGYYTQANGNFSMTTGNSCIADAINSMAGGFSSKTGKYANSGLVYGMGLEGNYEGGTVVGRYNIPDETWDSVFVVGNGDNDASRSDAVRVRKNGTVELPSIKNNNIGTNANNVATKGYVDNKLSNQVVTGSLNPVVESFQVICIFINNKFVEMSCMIPANADASDVISATFTTPVPGKLHAAWLEEIGGDRTISIQSIDNEEITFIKNDTTKGWPAFCLRVLLNYYS